MQVAAPLAWTTLSLTLHTDGNQEFELTGASPFPRHWVYDADGRLAAKSATVNYAQWSTEAFGRHTPWGDTDSPALVSEVESALERQLSSQIMQFGVRPDIRRVKAGQHLTTQGDAADGLFSGLTACCESTSTATLSPRLGLVRSSGSAPSWSPVDVPRRLSP